MKTKNTEKDLEFYKNEAERYRNMYNYKFDDNRVEAHAAIKDDQRVYRKVGKKFVPINDPYAYDGLRNGFWLIEVADGYTSIRQQIFPNKAPITAATRLIENELVGIIRKASEARPSVPLTPEQKKDWDKLIAKHGDIFSTLAYPSLQQNAEDIIAAILK